jgi:hypothetical protein
MYHKLLLIILALCCSLKGQERKMEWDSNSQIQFVDFKSSQINIDESVTSVFLNSGVMIDLAIQMSNFEFMFTKNFNSKLTCSFDKELAKLIAPDSVTANQLLRLVRFDFDLSELYTRKIRKELFENKKMFSNVTFFQPYFNKMNSERNRISSQIYNSTDFGKNASLLEKEHQAVKQEILLLSEYCRECKPLKKKS